MLSPVKRAELLFLAAIPALITLLCAVVFLAAKPVGGLDRFMPILPLMPVFYWSIAHARHMPYGFVFLLGLALDAARGLPLGLSSLLYMGFMLSLRANRRYVHKEGFLAQWGYFSLLLGAICILQWAILALFNSGYRLSLPPFLQWLLSVCCYPALHKAFDAAHGYIAARRWKILHGA